MTDNEALNHIAGTNEQIQFKATQIESNTSNLVDGLNQQMVYYSSPTLAYIQSGDRKLDTIIQNQQQIINGEAVIILGIMIYVIYYFVMRCLK